MIQIFRNNNPLTILALLLFALIAKYRCLIHPIIPAEVDGHFLYNGVINTLKYFFRSASYAYSLFAILILLLQALYLNYISEKHKLYNGNTYIPAFTFLLFTSVFQPFNYLSEMLLLNWIILFGMDTFLMFPKALHPKKVIFNAGFLFSCAFLLQSSFFIFFFLLLTFLLLYRTFDISELLVAIAGYITPFYIVVCILFLTNKLKLLPDLFYIGFSLSGKVEYPAVTLTIILVLLGLLLAGYYAMQQIIAFNNIHVRRDWYGITFYLLFSVLASLFIERSLGSAWLIVMPAYSTIVSLIFLLNNGKNKRQKRFSNFMFYFCLAFLTFCIFTNQ
jgi:hypothetical protein